MQTRRDHTLDTFKGILTFFMVYCHVLQFFGDSLISPVNEFWMQAANLLVFPGFLFAFGQNVQRSYYAKPIRQSAPRMLENALRLYIVFVISGLGFRVLRENKPFGSGTVMRILTLSDIPGWSEFIIAFALFLLAALLLFYPMSKWKGPLFPAVLGTLSLLTALIPYSASIDPRLQLLIGGRGFASFPLMQYLGFFCMGIALTRAREQKKPLWPLLLMAAAFSGLGGWRALSLGQMPERFPPDIGWVLLPFFPLALLYLLSAGLEKARLPLPRRLRGREGLALPLAPLRSLGRNSMLHLLLSNLLIFTMAGRGILPQLKMRSPWLFGQPIQTAAGAFWWTLALLCVLTIIASLASKPPRPVKKEESP